MQPLELIDTYYRDHERARKILLCHSQQVAELAGSVARHLSKNYPVDIEFVTEAAHLHDIGIFLTDAQQIGCFGKAPYIRHGVLGAGLLLREGLPKHALVCERHIGVGLSEDDIRAQKLPLPLRDMSPVTIEEKIIAYADLFFSKTRQGVRSIEKVRSSLIKHGEQKVAIFDQWHELFNHQDWPTG